MLSIQQYKKLQEYKELGLSKVKVSEKLNLSCKRFVTGGTRIKHSLMLFKRIMSMC